MKKHYTIKEISKMYDIGVDSLRYYEERGLIHPSRGDNNYRYYSLDDIYILNIIRDLRELDFSTDQIKTYLDDLNLQNTQVLLSDELKTVNKQIRELKYKQVSIKQRLKHLDNFKDFDVSQELLTNHPKRYCYELESRINTDEEADFMIKQLHHKHQDELNELGNLTIGSAPFMNHVDTFQSVFFMDTTEHRNADFIMEEGLYLSIFYQGSYRQSAEYLKRIMTLAEEKNLKTDNRPFEIYHIDNRYTNNEDEFITEVQIQIKDLD